MTPTRQSSNTAATTACCHAVNGLLRRMISRNAAPLPPRTSSISSRSLVSSNVGFDFLPSGHMREGSMLAPMSRPYLRRSDTSSAGEFRRDFFVPLPPRCPYKSPTVQNAHITHAHTKNNETIFYCTCNEGRGGTRGTNANCAKWTTHTSASHPATEPTGRHFGANAASFRDL